MADWLTGPILMKLLTCLYMLGGALVVWKYDVRGLELMGWLIGFYVLLATWFLMDRNGPLVLYYLSAASILTSTLWLAVRVKG